MEIDDINERDFGISFASEQDERPQLLTIVPNPRSASQRAIRQICETIGPLSERMYNRQVFEEIRKIIEGIIRFKSLKEVEGIRTQSAVNNRLEITMLTDINGLPLSGKNKLNSLQKKHINVVKNHLNELYANRDVLMNIIEDAKNELRQDSICIAYCNELIAKRRFIDINGVIHETIVNMSTTNIRRIQFDDDGDSQSSLTNEELTSQHAIASSFPSLSNSSSLHNSSSNSLSPSLHISSSNSSSSPLHNSSSSSSSSFSMSGMSRSIENIDDE
jgi:hypothetical protein